MRIRKIILDYDTSFRANFPPGEGDENKFRLCDYVDRLGFCEGGMEIQKGRGPIPAMKSNLAAPPV
jgi:hypothetical protein